MNVLKGDTVIWPRQECYGGPVLFDVTEVRTARFVAKARIEGWLAKFRLSDGRVVGGRHVYFVTPLQERPHLVRLNGAYIASHTDFIRASQEGRLQPRDVPLSDVECFGKLDRYCDSRAWTLAQLRDGSRWYSLYKDQTPDVARIMRTRLKGIHAVGAWRIRHDVSAWESPVQPAADCATGDSQRARPEGAS